MTIKEAIEFAQAMKAYKTTKVRSESIDSTVNIDEFINMLMEHGEVNGMARSIDLSDLKFLEN